MDAGRQAFDAINRIIAQQLREIPVGDPVLVIPMSELFVSQDRQAGYIKLKTLALLLVEARH